MTIGLDTNYNNLQGSSPLQWILTKLGTYIMYLVLKRIWNPIDCQGQKSNF